MVKRKSVKKARGTKASRSAAAKKAARTRKRNATKRSVAAKKAAVTRKRNANKRKSSAKKAAATRRRKSPKRKTTRRKAAKRTRGPSKAKRSAAAKKGWRTRKAKSTKRSNAAKRAARTRKGKTTRRKTKRKAAPKRRKSGRMTKAKRSAAAKKGWRTRRRGGSKRKTTRRKAKRRYVKAGTVKAPGMTDFMPSTIKVKGFTDAMKAFPKEFMNESFGDLKNLSMVAVAGFSLMGTLAVAKGEIWDRIGVTAMVGDQLGAVHPDLANTFDAMLDLATLSVLGMALTKGLGVSPKWVTPGRQIAQVFVAADFVRNIELLGIGNAASDMSGDIRNVLPSVSNITGLIPGISGIGGLGQSSNQAGVMFGMHDQAALGMSHGNNNLALAMSPNMTAATGNSKFFGTQSLGSTRVNLF